jgi:hypothetical protein
MSKLWLENVEPLWRERGKFAGAFEASEFGGSPKSGWVALLHCRSTIPLPGEADNLSCDARQLPVSPYKLPALMREYPWQCVCRTIHASSGQICRDVWYLRGRLPTSADQETRPPLTPEQIQVLKKNLAQIILASACNGKRDAARLKEIALRGVSGRLSQGLGVFATQLLPLSLSIT